MGTKLLNADTKQMPNYAHHIACFWLFPVHKIAKTCFIFIAYLLSIQFICNEIASRVSRIFLAVPNVLHYRQVWVSHVFKFEV